MFSLIKKVLAKPSTVAVVNDEKFQRAHIALCVLLLEAAHVDGNCSDEERDHVISTLVTEYNIPRKEIDDLLYNSETKRKEAVDLFTFTRYLNNNFSKAERLAVMKSVWRIIHIDGRLEAHEDHLAHKLANLLRLTHKELIDCKIEARRQLAEEKK